MQYYDITRCFSSGMPTWPGDTPTECELVASIKTGSSVNVSRFTTSTHSGTHVDAPYHFSEDGETINQLKVDPFWGLAQVVSVEKESGPLYPSDLTSCDLGRARRLILVTACSHNSSSGFPEKIAHPSPELVEHLSELDIILLGTDAPSVDALDDPSLPGHKMLHNKGIAILEGLYLKNVPDGLYELVALPLNIQGADGAPCRAVLKCV
jgi:arylformamidase